MKFDVILSGIPFWDNGKWVTSDHVQVHKDLVKSPGCYAGIMPKRLMKEDKTFDSLFTRHSWAQLNDPKHRNYGGNSLYYYIWKT
jgi:hypothetical protein